MITAVVLTGRLTRAGDQATVVPDRMVVRQISVVTGQQLRMLYRSKLPRDDIGASHVNLFSMSPDSSGQHWIIGTGFNVYTPGRSAPTAGSVTGSWSR